MRNDIDEVILTELSTTDFNAAFENIEQGCDVEQLFESNLEYYNFLRYGEKLFLTNEEYIKLEMVIALKNKFLQSIPSTPDEFVIQYKDFIFNNEKFKKGLFNMDDVSLAYVTHTMFSYDLIEKLLLRKLSDHPLKKYYGTEHVHEIIHRLLVNTYKVLKIENGL